MTFTYSGDPSSSPADAVRFILADTVEETAALSDAEVAWLVSQWPDEYAAAIAGAAMLEARYAREADSVTRTVGDLRLAFGNSGGNLGNSGCVAYLFQPRGVITIDGAGLTEDRVMEAAIEAGARLPTVTVNGIGERAGNADALQLTAGKLVAASKQLVGQIDPVERRTRAAYVERVDQRQQRLPAWPPAKPPGQHGRHHPLTAG